MACAVIVACGKGKRMYPYTEKWHKACLPVCNIPIIERMVLQLRELGIKDIRVVADGKIEQIKHCLRKYKISYFEAPHTTGTADAALVALNGYKRAAVVLCSDIVIDNSSLRNMLTKTNCTSVLLRPAVENEQISFGAKVVEDKVTAIYGQPRKSYADSVIAGVYHLSPAALQYLKTNPGRMLKVPVGGMPPEQSVIEQSLQTFCEDGNEVIAVNAVEFAVDVNFPWDLLKANQLAAGELLKVVNATVETKKIHSSAVIEGRVRLGKNSRIGRNVVIQGDVWIGDNTVIDYGAIIEGNCVIGSNCLIKNNCLICSDTIIGDFNKIGFCAQVSGMTLDNVCIVHHSEIYALIGSHVDIGAGTMMGTLRFDDKQSLAQAGEYANCSYIGDYTRCGVSNVFYPGVVVGCNCALGPGAIIKSNVESNSLILVEQQQVKKYWGPEKYGW
ncbi:MAG: sugar phosphate nucleotidyltransferase [Negativicutes bacterium]|jgi:bifunctional UDP-N-acetylglucosamine pyrophosphorylase/glucosamine-1-phosphate N-acetyltransferase